MTEDAEQAKRELNERIRAGARRVQELLRTLTSKNCPVLRMERQGPGHRVLKLHYPDDETEEREMSRRDTCVRLHAECKKLESEFGEEYGGEWKFNPEAPSLATSEPLTIAGQSHEAVVSYNHNRNEWVALILTEDPKGGRSGVHKDAVEALQEAIEFMHVERLNA